jgi:hypothetical protein
MTLRAVPGAIMGGLSGRRIKTATSFSISNAQNKGRYNAQVLWLRGSGGFIRDTIQIKNFIISMVISSAGEHCLHTQGS